MLDNENLAANVLRTPAILQSKVLQDISSRFDGGVASYDPNNAFVMMLDTQASLTSQFVRQEDTKYQAIYPRRAQTGEELYSFMSDYDYLNITASPASIRMRLVLNRDDIVARSTSYDDNYNATVISENTVFTMGSRTFGLYYPIKMLVNKVTQVITVTYDSTVANPLQTLSTNQLYSVSEYSAYGLNLIEIVFDTYQFTRTRYTATVDPEVGFTSKIQFTDKFYAARVYTLFNGVWTELSYTLSQIVYDVNTPTAMLTLLLDENTVTVSIPQIYFANNLVGSDIRVDLFTTEGVLNVTIPAEDASSIQVNYDLANATYADALQQPKTQIIAPYEATSIVGGANPLTFEQLRTGVVNGTLNGGIPITSMQIEAAVNKYGYKLVRYLDNITTRIFFALSTMTTANTNRIIPVTVSGIRLTNDYLNGDPSTILQFEDGMVTILPTTLFKYSPTADLSIPVTDDESEMLSTMTKSELVTYLNGNMYTRQPFHLILDTGSKSPQAKTINMMAPEMTNLQFISENAHSAAQMSVTSSVITHQASGTGGYIIKLGVKKSDALKGISDSDLLVMLIATTATGSTTYLQAEYLNTTSDGLAVYSCVLPTNYYITMGGSFRTKMTSPTTGLVVDSDIPLTTVFDIRLGGKQSLFPTVSNDVTLTAGMPLGFTDYLIFSKQKMTIAFAKDLSPLIYNIVDTTWGGTAYQTYTQNQYATNPYPIYATDASGVPLYKAGASSNGLIQIFPAGSPTVTGQPFRLTVQQSQASASPTITVDDVVGVYVGMPIQGQGIPTNTVVKSINASANTITMSAPPAAALVSGTVVILPNANVTTPIVGSDVASGSNTLTVAWNTSLYAGMSVFGFGIPQGTVVTKVAKSGTNATVSISNNTSAIVPANSTVLFLNTVGPRFVTHYAGDKVLMANGQPQTITEATNVYRIQATQFDARLYASEDANDIAYLATLPATLTSMSQSLDPIRNDLMEETYLYYKPFRTMGSATFNLGNGKSTTLDLGMGFQVTLYVDAPTYKNNNLKSVLKSTVISTINTCLTQTVISIEDISSQIKTALADSVKAIAMAGINGDETLRTISPATPDTAPNLALVLDQAEDGTLRMSPNVTITYVLSPDE